MGFKNDAWPVNATFAGVPIKLFNSAPLLAG